MKIRPKTVRRLLILFGVMLVIAGGLFGAFEAMQARNAAVLARLRKQAMAAYSAGDYPTSVNLLGQYIAKAHAQDRDADALYAYGKSRVNVEMPRLRHIIEGISAYQAYLELRPKDDKARHELLALYATASYNAEAIKLADALLAANPMDVDALDVKAWALINQRNYKNALEVCRKVNQIAPLNVRGQFRTVQLLHLSGAADDAVIAHAEQLRQAHKGDPRFELLLAYADLQTHQEDLARKWLSSAASHVPPDASFVVNLVRLLESAGLFSDCDAFIRRSADVLADPPVQRLLAQRLWEDRKFSELADRFKDLDPNKPASDSVLLGYRALALEVLGKRADAQPLIDALARRSAPSSARADAAAGAWAAALRAQYAVPPLPAPELVSQLRQALGRQPASPLLHQMLGEALIQTGEVELALEQFAQSCALAPSWATPWVLRSRTYAGTGRPAEALDAAQEAVRRAPQRYDAQTALILAAFATDTQAGATEGYARLLPRLEALHAVHDPLTWPIYVTVLARMGDNAKALALANEALAARPPLPVDALLRLGQACDYEKIALGDAFRKTAQDTYGPTPQIALAQAEALLERGESAEGLADLLQHAKGHEKELPWRLALARYREAAHAPEALRDWIALGDAYPENLEVQQAILRAPSRTGDRAFWQRTIDRLKAISGEEALTWRIAQGQWLLSGTPSDRDCAQAVNLLTRITRAAPTLAEPHRLLAQAMEHLHNSAGAISELTAAADDKPGDPLITGELVRLLIADHRSADALAYLDKLAQNPKLTLEARQALARTYVSLGHDDKAVALLQAGDARGAAAAERDWILARLYRRDGKIEQAARLYKSLVHSAITDPALWAEGAEFFASQKDMTTAQLFLSRLSKLTLGPGVAERMLGEFAEQWLSESDARQHFQAATRAAPKDASAWLALSGFELRHGQYADAAKDAAAGLMGVPNNAPLRAMHESAVKFATLRDAAQLQPVAELLSHSPSDAGGVAMLVAAVDAQGAHLPMEATARKIEDVAAQYPSELFLQTQAVRMDLRAGRSRQAAELARRAAQTNPDSPEPHRLLTSMYAEAREWDNAREEALMWRQRTSEQPYGADLTLAQIYLQQPRTDAAGALRVLAPYVAEKDAAQERPAAVQLEAKALVLEGRASDAADLLKPLLPQAAMWRTTWLNLAARLGSADAATQWIRQAIPYIPHPESSQPAAGPEQYDLARAWYEVGMQFQSTEALESARRVLAPVLGSSDCPSRAWVLAALTAEAQGDYPAAEKAQRRLLALDPKSPDVQNDLAYVLWLEGQAENLPEARRLAESAVAARPQLASYRDTLARIQARAGDSKAAAASFRAALKRDPNSIEALLGLADLLSHDPATQSQAKDLFAQIQRLMQTHPMLTPVLRKQLQVVQKTLASAG